MRTKHSPSSLRYDDRSDFTVGLSRAAACLWWKIQGFVYGLMLIAAMGFFMAYFGRR